MMPEMMGRKPAVGGEKSNFAVTCNLLSQFIKERGSIADFAPRSGARPPMTMSLLPGADVTGDAGRSAPRSMDLFPQRAGISAAAAAAADVREPEKAQQLTIFYGGRVMVFDSFPPEKAKDLMQHASKLSAAATSGAGNAAGTLAAAAAAAKQANVPSHGSPAQKSTSNNPPAAAVTTAAAAQKPPQPAATISYLPIARKASLHRFLEKRKDRINAKAPYQSDPPPAVKKEEGGEPWLGLGPQISNPSQSSDCSK